MIEIFRRNGDLYDKIDSYSFKFSQRLIAYILYPDRALLRDKNFFFMVLAGFSGMLRRSIFAAAVYKFASHRDAVAHPCPHPSYWDMDGVSYSFYHGMRYPAHRHKGAGRKRGIYDCTRCAGARGQAVTLPAGED